jgi:hypothetical protein
LKVLLRALVVGAVELVAAHAAAEPHVAVERPEPASCVDATELVQTLAHARIRVEPPAGTPATAARASSAERVVVSIQGTPEALRVTLQREGSDTTEILPAATCATATDAVAAFLSSALGPPPRAHGPVALAELEHAIGEELARRGIQLALVGVRMTLARDTSGEVSAHLENPSSPRCSGAVALGIIDELSPENVSDASDALARVIAANGPCPPLPVPPPPPGAPPRPSPWAEPERALALQKALGRLPGTKQRYAISAISLVFGLGGAWLILAEGNETPPRSAGAQTLRAFGTGVLIGGGVGGMAIGADRGIDYLWTVYFAGFGLLTAGDSFEGSHFAARATSAGFLASATLSALNVVHPRPLQRLARDKQEVSEEGLTRVRAREIEQDLERADPVIPQWLVFTPAFIGTSAAAIHTLATRPDHPDFGDLFLAFALGAGIVIDLNQGSIWGSYEQALHAVGLKQLALAPGPTPLGLSLTGRF